VQAAGFIGLYLLYLYVVIVGVPFAGLERVANPETKVPVPSGEGITYNVLRIFT